MRSPWVAGVLVVLLGACSPAAHPAASPSTTTRTTPTTAPAAAQTTGPTSSTTTAYHASAAQPSPEKAASHLVDAWRAADRAAALTAATPIAVQLLLAQPYPAAGAQFRSCDQAVAGPSACAYRVGSGLLTLNALSADGGWIIASAVFQG